MAQERHEAQGRGNCRVTWDAHSVIDGGPQTKACVLPVRCAVGDDSRCAEVGARQLASEALVLLRAVAREMRWSSKGDMRPIRRSTSSASAVSQLPRSASSYFLAPVTPTASETSGAACASGCRVTVTTSLSLPASALPPAPTDCARARNCGKRNASFSVRTDHSSVTKGALG